MVLGLVARSGNLFFCALMANGLGPSGHCSKLAGPSGKKVLSLVAITCSAQGQHVRKE